MGLSIDTPLSVLTMPATTHLNGRWILHVASDPDLSSTAKVAAAVMAVKWMDYRTLGNCHPGPTLLAAAMGLPPVTSFTDDKGHTQYRGGYATARRVVAELVRHGYLVRVHTGGIRRGQNVTSTYAGRFPKRNTGA